MGQQVKTPPSLKTLVPPPWLHHGETRGPVVSDLHASAMYSHMQEHTNNIAKTQSYIYGLRVLTKVALYNEELAFFIFMFLTLNTNK